jgi:aspartyl/asparaginyl-tRNA synthetase
MPHKHTTNTPNIHLVLLLLLLSPQLFREAMLKQDFQEIHTPKLIAGASEGGAAVFRSVWCTHCVYACVILCSCSCLGVWHIVA